MKKAKKKPIIIKDSLFEAVFLSISAIAPGGYIGFLWWRSTLSHEETWINPVSILLAALAFSSLYFMAAKVFNLLRSYRKLQQRVLAAHSARDTTPPKEFFAAHREDLTALNALLLADGEPQRQPKHIYYSWNFSEWELGASTEIDWSVTLTEEQLQTLASLGYISQFFCITLTPDSITYNFDCSNLVYVLQHSESQEQLEHLDGNWYYY